YTTAHVDQVVVVQLLVSGVALGGGEGVQFLAVGCAALPVGLLLPLVQPRSLRTITKPLPSS
ncbi:hypothetical protein, partial [Marinimicrobium sp. ARAG 43.8]|uniref:hypothetical protein n=1 Tax=Marinimicrobium sp. ARAG 43.8 TaxID=3418719 RepID=UPI003CFB3AF1